MVINKKTKSTQKKLCISTEGTFRNSYYEEQKNIQREWEGNRAQTYKMFKGRSRDWDR